MNKNIYLTKQEQILFDTLSRAKLIYTDEIRDFFPDLKTSQINKICSKLSAKRYLFRLKKGVYLVQDGSADAPVIEDPYQIALALFPGYIGFSSALRIYDLLDYEPFTIFVVTKNKSREKKIGAYTFKSVAMGRKATGVNYYKGVYISSLAKTFFDCFYKPQFCGGFSTITKAMYEATVDWVEFTSFFELASGSMFQRTGYILELLKTETDKKVPNNVLRYFRSNIKNNAKLLASGRSGGEYIGDWMLLDNLGRENILSWWIHG